MDTKTDLCNMALISLRGKRLSNIDQDSTIEAEVCRVYYDQVLQGLFEAFDWPFATTEDALGKVSDNPTDEWAYAYGYPVHGARLIKITSSSDAVIRYSVNYSRQGRLIYTNEEAAKIVYVKKVEETVDSMTHCVT